MPPYAIVGGVPAKVIRWRYDDKTIDEVKKSEWWRYDLADAGEVDWKQPREAALRMTQMADAGILRPYAPHVISTSDLVPYHLWQLFHFEVGCRCVRIKVFGFWLFHWIFKPCFP